MAKNIEHENLIDVLKGDARQVDFMKMIYEQQETIRKLERMAGGKPNKVEQAYFEQQNARLKDLEAIVKSWIWEAFYDDEQVGVKTGYFGEMFQNYEVQVIVKKRK
jgi:hypothetical protein